MSAGRSSSCRLPRLVASGRTRPHPCCCVRVRVLARRSVRSIEATELASSEGLVTLSAGRSSCRFAAASGCTPALTPAAATGRVRVRVRVLARRSVRWIEATEISTDLYSEGLVMLSAGRSSCRVAAASGCTRPRPGCPSPPKTTRTKPDRFEATDLYRYLARGW